MMKRATPPILPAWAWAGGFALLAALCAVGLVEALLGPALLAALDAKAHAVVQDITLRAGAAFAISKTINAALSFAQEVTISGGIGVAGASANPARFLEPVNNLVDQFALVMLAAAAAAAVIDVLMTLGGAWGIALFLPVGLGLLAVRWVGEAFGWSGARRFGRLGLSVVVLALVARIGLPLAVLLTGTISDQFLAERYDRANAGLQLVEEQAEAAAGEAARLEQGAVAAPAEPGIWGNLWDLGSGAARGLTDVTGALSLLGASFDGLFDDVVTLVTVFLLETLVLPLLLVWLLYRGLAVLLLAGRR